MLWWWIGVVALVVVGSGWGFRHRLDRATSSKAPPAGTERERAEALRQVAGEIERGRSAAYRAINY